MKQNTKYTSNRNDSLVSITEKHLGPLPPLVDAPTCDQCQLPEDGLRVRKVTPRSEGTLTCADCWKESGQRKAAQEQYITRLAAECGITTDALENRLLSDLAAGVPNQKTMVILTNMFHAAERVNANPKEDTND